MFVAQGPDSQTSPDEIEQGQRQLARIGAENQRQVFSGYNMLPPELQEALLQRLRTARSRPCPPVAVSYNSIQIAGGYGETSIPRGNYGFMRDGPFGTAPDLPALLSVPRVPVLVIEGAATIQDLGRINLGYKEGNRRNFVDLPTGPAGTARGFPYTRRSLGGSAGITGNVPARIENFVEVQAFSAGFTIPVFYGVHDKLTPGAGMVHDGGPAMWTPRPRFDLFVSPFIVFRDRDHFGTVAITTPVIATQTLDQRVNELEVGVGVGVSVLAPLGDRVRLNFEAEADIYGHYYGLKSIETVALNFGPPADRAATRQVDGSNNGMGYRGSVRGELAFDLSGRPVDGQSRGGIELFVGGRAAYLSDRAQIINPLNGDFILAGGTTRLGTDNAFDWHAFAGIRIPFGRR